jgi:hypothetical protein
LPFAEALPSAVISALRDGVEAAILVSRTGEQRAPSRVDEHCVALERPHRYS